MHLYKLITGIAIAISALPSIGAPVSQHIDVSNGFSITPPAFNVENSLGTIFTSVVFQGSTKGGTTPSCNVQVQNVTWTPSQFEEISKNQFSTAGLNIDKKESRKVSGRDAILYGFSNSETKALALAVFENQKVFLVTCMASVARFEENKSIFEATINSFSLNAK